jgi:hypothetical protein
MSQLQEFMDSPFVKQSLGKAINLENITGSFGMHLNEMVSNVDTVSDAFHNVYNSFKRHKGRSLKVPELHRNQSNYKERKEKDRKLKQILSQFKWKKQKAINDVEKDTMTKESIVKRKDVSSPTELMKNLETLVKLSKKSMLQRISLLPYEDLY